MDERDETLRKAFKIIFDQGKHSCTAEEFLAMQSDWRKAVSDSLPTMGCAGMHGEEHRKLMTSAINITGKKASGER